MIRKDLGEECRVRREERGKWRSLVETAVQGEGDTFKIEKN